MGAKMHKFQLRTALFFLMFWGWYGPLHAQEIRWSNARKLKGLAVFTKVIGQNESGLFLLRYKSRFLSRNVILEKYRHELGYAYSKNLILRKSQLEYAGLIDNRIVLIKSDFDKKERRKDLRAIFYENDLQQSSPDLPLISSNAPGGYERSPFMFAGNTQGTKLIIAKRQSTQDGNSTRFELHTYNERMEPIHFQSVDFAYPFKDVFPLELVTDDILGTHLLIRLRVKSARKMDTKSHLYLLHFNQNEVHEYVLGDSQHFYTQAVLNYDHFGKRLIVQQVYGKSVQEGQKGIYTFSLGADAKVNEHYLAFDSSMIESMHPQRTLSGKNYLSDYGLLRLVPQNDGGILSIIERSSVSSEEDILMVSGVPQNTSRNIYNYEDICVISQSSEGAIHWYHVINKSQSTINDGGYYSSVIPLVTSEAVHMVFNDMLLNIGTALQYTIWADGSMQSKILLGNEREYVSVIPSEAQQISAFEWLLPVMKDRKFALVKLNYPR